MKKMNKLFIGLFLAVSTMACQDDWDSHYKEQHIVVDNTASVELADMSGMDYLAGHSEFSELYQVFKDNGLVDSLGKKNQSYTMLACDNEAMAKIDITDVEFFVNSSMCNVPVIPSQLVNGSTMKMWCGKYLQVSVEEIPLVAGSETTAETERVVRISGKKVLKVVKTNDGYIYVMETPVLAPKSLFEVFEDLDEVKYSRFKALVRSYEIKDFDKANSKPVGVDKTGNTVYDSVFIIKNTYLDRYKSYDKDKKEYSSPTWNMRSEAYTSTMLIPSDEVFEACFNQACKNVVEALGRPVNAADSLKFNEWILRACFYDGALTTENLQGAADLYSIAGYCMEYTAALTAAQWRPSVQNVDVVNPIIMSNGVGYYITSMKIPNNVVIWRIKNRLYNTYNACTADEKVEYFTFENATKIGTRSITSAFGGWGNWPAIPYDYLHFAATGVAYGEKLPVGVEFTGLSLNADGTVAVVNVPPGEYNLRMGFNSDGGKQKWTMNIYFDDQLVIEGKSPVGANYDRDGVAEFPEYYNPDDIPDKNANKYDKDGSQIAVVTVTGDRPRPIRIRVVSHDYTKVMGNPGQNADGTYKDGTATRGNDCMQVYHWCLRPTINNY